jgi:hypothetical protein
MNTFKNDLLLSQKYELELLKHLQNVERFEQAASDQPFTEYDIKIFMSDGSIKTYEVKCDKFCNGFNGYSTNNIAIEYQQFREGIMKKTGISKSRAKYYAIFCLDSISGYELFIIKRKKLKMMINNKEFIDIKMTKDFSHFVLMTKEQIKDNSIYYKSVW